ncbi:hypothetical protein ARMSODRAFT_438599 [Armillaria solidipes]|uniref:Uncharacterized protein n=1 Tax=Armillaria solidipes TaxID=1076256 RepID=A0A2H3B2Y0_9AGAR|nr:hypothetical protein ARMSODRAFT_438599 [Armillaria solidipes]
MGNALKHFAYTHVRTRWNAAGRQDSFGDRSFSRCWYNPNLTVPATRRIWAVLLSTSAVTALSRAGIRIGIYSSKVHTHGRPVIAPYKYPDGATCTPYATNSSHVSLPIARRPMICVSPFKYISLGAISRSTQSDVL